MEDEEDPSLPNNYDMTIIDSAWLWDDSLEKKFENNPEIKERYAKSIQDGMQKGYVKKRSKEEVRIESKVTWYGCYENQDLRKLRP